MTTTTIPEYIGDDRRTFIQGEVGFLLCLHNRRRGFSRWDLRSHPVRTADSLKPVLSGKVLGVDTDVEAHGMAVVLDVTKNGRGRIEQLPRLVQGRVDVRSPRK